MCSHADDSTAFPSPTVLWGEEKEGPLGICMGCFASSHIAIRVAVNVNVVVGAVICSFRWGEKLDGMCETSFGENSESLYGVDDSTKNGLQPPTFPLHHLCVFCRAHKGNNVAGSSDRRALTIVG